MSVYDIASNLKTILSNIVARRWISYVAGIVSTNNIIKLKTSIKRDIRVQVHIINNSLCDACVYEYRARSLHSFD